MFLSLFCRSLAGPGRMLGRGRTIGFALPIALLGSLIARGECVTTESKRVIGATAILTEASSGLSFPARIDTGAASCSLHVEAIEIKNESANRVENVGKPIRFLVKAEDGRSEWIETTIASAVRIRSSVFTDGEYERRYKVPLTLEWKDFSKEVLVTLSDRGNMRYPLLIGRNYLKGDFLVDVEKGGD